MPTYEYKCDACEKTFERFQSITSEPIKKCPYCKKQKVRRLISGGAGLIFKGSGFYITDYRSDSYKSASKSDSGSSTSSTPAKSDTGKSDSGGSSKPAESKPSESKSSESKPSSDKK
jgi:putative FmdB family regulatory protein